MARLGQFRRDTLTNWRANNPVLADGEFALIAENDAKPKTYTHFCCGDGETPFNKLLIQNLGNNGGTSAILGLTQELGESQSEATSQDLVTKALSGNKALLKNDGFQYPFIYLGDFSNFNQAMDVINLMHGQIRNLTKNQYLGYFKFKVNDKNIDLHNYISDYQNDVWNQVIKGSVDIVTISGSENNLVESPNFNIITRQFRENAWSKWTKFTSGGSNASDTSELLKWNSNLAQTRNQVDLSRRKPGFQISYKNDKGVWINEQYIGENVDNVNWGKDINWQKIGASSITGVIKKLSVNGTVYSPDENGLVYFPAQELDVDDSLNSLSTNPVQNQAVAKEFEKLDAKYGIKLRLNEIERNGSKVFTIDLLDKNDNILSTTDEWSGGGGGPVATRKIVLTRLTDNLFIKNGSEAKLQYQYDQIDSTSQSTTGNSAKVEIEVIYGATKISLNQICKAGAIQTIDVTQYLKIGSNLVKAKFIVGEGEDQQISSLSWTINVINLVLKSSFNFATITNRGDNINIPYFLQGSGVKTLRCYVDGNDVEDRTITSSSSNGSFNIVTSNMFHGNHSVQLVAELEIGSNTIKSNSIYMDLAIKENRITSPIIMTRFEYEDGTIIEKGQRPYIAAKQFENFSINYSAFNPNEVPTEVSIYINDKLISSNYIRFVENIVTQKNLFLGNIPCKIVCKDTEYRFNLNSTSSGLSLVDPVDNMVLKLSAQGKTNNDIDKNKWNYEEVTTEFNNFKFGGDGWINGVLRHTGEAKSVIKYTPFYNKNGNNASAFIIKYKVSDVVDDTAEVLTCLDEEGTGLKITATEVSFQTKGKGRVSMKMAAGQVYEVALISFPVVSNSSSDYEKENERMVYLYINGILSGAVQKGLSDSIYQTTPQYIKSGSNKATFDIYFIKAYNNYLTDSQVLDSYIINQNTIEEISAKYKYNNILNEDGNVSVQTVPEDMRYIIVTGVQDNGVATALQAAVVNNKKAKYDVDEILCVKKSDPSLNFVCTGGCISLQGTSSLAYPIKNYRLWFKNTKKVAGQLYLGCDSQGVGGTLQDSPKYSFRKASKNQKAAIPVDCFCLKADYAESSSSHNTGMAKIVQNTLAAIGELTPAQKYTSATYPYDVRTTVDGEPCYLFYRATKQDTPIFLGKYNFNNDKSTEDVFGFLNIPGYHKTENGTEDSNWIKEKFQGKNPTQCWEFLNNDFPMGSFLDDNFSDDNWKKVFECRFPDGGTDLTYLKPLVQWIKATKDDGAKFKRELSEYFDVKYLCDYYIFTDIFGAVDQRVKNMMLAFWYNPKVGKVLAYMIFYDNDTIMGVRNDGRLKYGWDIDENTLDTELSTESKKVYAYAGHDSILWKNLREQFSDELRAAYKRIRAKLSNDTIYKMFDKEQASKFCERIYNLDAINKYIKPKTLGIDVVSAGVVQKQTYSYLEAMQGSRESHRHWWIQNRLNLFDARYSTGNYTSTDLTWKGNSAAGAMVKAIPSRDFYFELRREGETLNHQKVNKGEEFTYTYQEMANVGTIFHLLGCAWADSIDLSNWGGFTDLTIPILPVLKTLILGGKPNTEYSLTELVIGSKMPVLETLDIRNYISLPSLDLSSCSRIKNIDARGCVQLSTISFAEGAPIENLKLPSNYQLLILNSINTLTWNNILFENITNLRGISITNCSQLNGNEILNKLMSVESGSLKYIRLDIGNIKGNGNILKTLKEKNFGGIDSKGSTIETKCKLLGTYQLNVYIDSEELTSLQEYFDELKIKNVEYTAIEFDNTVFDPKNISNLDNNTGYKFNKDYIPSGHILNIKKKRHKVLMKKTGENTVTYCNLNDDNSLYYADGQEANLQDYKGEGEIFIHEPHYWYKGVNDVLNNKQYHLYNSETPNPLDESLYKKIPYENGEFVNILYGKKISNVSKSDKIINQIQYSQGYNIYRIKLEEGFNRVRFRCMSVYYNTYQSVFCDEEDNILKIESKSDLYNNHIDGMYIVDTIPEGAKFLYISLSNVVINSGILDYILLLKTDSLNYIEPDWCESKECMKGVQNCIFKEGKIVTENKFELGLSDYNIFTKNIKNPDIMDIYKLWDYDTHKNVCNLVMALTGNRLFYASYNGWKDNAELGMKSTIWNNSHEEYYKGVGYEGLAEGYSCFVTLSYCCLADFNFNFISKDRVEIFRYKNRVSFKSVTTGYFSVVLNERYMDIFGINNLGSQKTNYGAVSDFTTLNNSYVSLLNPHWQSALSLKIRGKDNFLYRFVFEGKMIEEKDSSRYKEIKNLR